MSASKLFAAGYRDIISVTVPGGQPSPKSKLQVSQFGKVPGLKGKDGLWKGFDWLSFKATAAHAKAWDDAGANVGLLAAHWPGLDLDVEDEVLVRVIRKFADQHLGQTRAVRMSREPRKLLVYRAEVPFARMALTIRHNDQNHVVEVLGEGRQYVVSGRHPAGVDYRWAGDPLWSIPPKQIPLITQEKVETFLTALKVALEEKGLVVNRTGTGAIVGDSPDPELLKAPSIEEFDALPLPPNPEHFGWDEFVGHGYAYYAAGADDLVVAFEKWCAWAAQHSKFSQEECDHQWEKGFHNSRVGWRWLQEQAEKGGNYSSAVSDFTVIPGSESTTPVVAPVTAAGTGRIKHTDEWVVAQILPELRHRLAYVPGASDNGRWFLWSGSKWASDGRLAHQGVIRGVLLQYARKWYEMGSMAPSKAEGAVYVKTATRYQSADGIRAVTSLLRAPLAVAETDFDKDIWILHTPGGTVDLRTGVMVPSVPEGMNARSTGVAPAPGPHPKWDTFLTFLTHEDVAYQQFIQRLMGYFLTGDTSEKMLSFVYGGTDTGKSRFVRVLMALMGDYADSVGVESFIKRGKHQNQSGTSGIARLPGTRLVTAPEPDVGDAWDASRIKSITGGDAISARFLYGQEFSFIPQFKILIPGNHEPEIKHVDDAMLRRLVVMPADRKVTEDMRIPDIDLMLVAEEGPQILQWAIEGCLEWKRQGLNPPPVVKASTQEYAVEQDTMRRWVVSRMEKGEDKGVSRDELYSDWHAYARAQGEYPCGPKAFKGLFRPYARKLGITDENALISVGDQRKRGYRGIGLRPLSTMDFGAV